MNEEYLKQRELQKDALSQKFLGMQEFPVEKNKITVAAFEGDGGFCCNPKYIVQELHRRDPKLKFVWLTKDVTRPFPEYIEVAEYNEDNIAYHLSTSQVWIDNYRKPYGTLKREGQLYIQTWHGVLGFKPIGLCRGDKFPEIARRVSKWDSDMIDRVVLNSDINEEQCSMKLLYEGEKLRTGFPKIDPIINDRDNYQKRIREILGLNQDIMLLLFAPTFRGGNQAGKKHVNSDIPTVDFDRLIECLEKKTGKKWNILLRLHPQLSARMDRMPLDRTDVRLIDVSQYPDINELIAGTDILLTDYSSCGFDAAYGGVPVLLYADDVADYIADRGSFMWERDELPFMIAENNDELLENVKRFDLELYRKSVQQFMKRYGIKEDGHASERVADYILKYINGIDS